MADTYRTAALVFAEYPPCFQPLLFTLGAPGFVPPCILHRRLPVTAGDWHSVPKREGLVERRASATDRRRVLVSLAGHASHALRELLGTAPLR